MIVDYPTIKGIYMGKHSKTSMTYAGGISSPDKPRNQPTLGSYVQGRNLQPQQFGNKASSPVRVQRGS
jgi:hypothetical protein